MRKKKAEKGILIFFAGFLIYIAVGALAPFVIEKKVSKSFKNQFTLENFYDDDLGVDRAVVVETSLDALHTRIQMIHQATTRIVLSTFDIREGESCNDIFSAIQEAADRGVKVQILVDGVYGGIHMIGKSVFYALGTNPNIEIRFYNFPNLLKPWSINGRMHDKYILIDDQLLLMGGRNTFDYFLGEYNLKNLSYDRDVLVYNTAHGTSEGSSSAVAQVDRYFQTMWNSGYCKTVFQKPSKKMQTKLKSAKADLQAHYQELISANPELGRTDIDFTKRTIPIKKATLLSNPIHTMGKEPLIWYQVKELMEHANQRVLIQTPYAVFSDEMYEGMEKIKTKVPDFSMMINSVAVGDNFMASSDYIHNREKILNTGVTVFEFYGNHSSHGKSILIDSDISMIGSYNLDCRSTYGNTELMLVIHSEELNQQLEQYMNKMLEQSLEVQPDGSYVENPSVVMKELSGGKKVIFAITSRLFQLIRNLI